MKKRILLGTTLLSAMMLTWSPVYADDGEITIIHTGDFHGHLVPRPNMRSDGNAYMEGGLARVYKKIKQIREDNPNALLLHTGDTIQGSAEVLFTRGQAMVDVMNHFGVDAFAPGNWEFVYGPQRFLELFEGPNAKAPWNAVAANLYYTTSAEDATAPYASKGGQRVLPPYVIKNVGGLKVGILGFTTDRGPQVVGRNIIKGFKVTNGEGKIKVAGSGTDMANEVATLVPHLRDVEQVDLVVVLSELGLAANNRLAELYPGIDVILSSDMHEETKNALIATNKVTGGKTIIVEEGQDGTMMGELKLEVKNKQIVEWKWKSHHINSKMKEDKGMAKIIADVRKSFVSGPDFVQHVNPFNGSRLLRPIDSVVGYTLKPLHRSNFSHEDMPGIVEGSSHDFLADAFRAMTGADIGAIRGFRYGTHVAPGPITMEDLYHFVPIGPQIAKGTITGGQLKNQIEAAADGSMNPDVSKWTGGWLFNFSGVTMNLDPYKGAGLRASNIKVNGNALVPTNTYTYASYWYARDPAMINVVPATNISVLKDVDGVTPLDGTEVVVRYLDSLPGKTVDTQLNRITLLQPLPPAPYGLDIVQPLRGSNLMGEVIVTGTKGGVEED